MAELVLAPLTTLDAEAYWRVYVRGRSDLPTASVQVHVERYLQLPPEERRTYFAIKRDGEFIGTIRLLPGRQEPPGANLVGFSMDPAHAGLASRALIKAVDLLRAQGTSPIVASFEDRYEPAFAAIGFTRWFARLRMEAPTTRGSVPADLGLRPPEEPEVAKLTSFFMDVYAGHMEQAFGMHVGSEADWREYMTALLKGASGRFMPDASFVALDSDRIVGAILTTDWMETPLIAEIGVAKDRRGRGLGRALLQRTLNRLVDLDMPRLGLFVTEGNDPAIRLYETMGFAQVGGKSVTARIE